MKTRVDEPLTMTVHRLPALDEQGARDMAATRAGRWKMLALLLVCVAPVALSYLLYYGVRPNGRSNYGELVQPQRPLPAFSGMDTQGRLVPLTSLKNQWLLISVADSACHEGCQKHLYLQRQLRQMLGREKERLDWVWLRTGGQAALAPTLTQATVAAVVLRVDAAQLATWLEPAKGQRLEDHLYLVDPMGNWMLRFPVDIDPKKARRDLERLLRASAFWDTPGR